MPAPSCVFCTSSCPPSMTMKIFLEKVIMAFHVKESKSEQEKKVEKSAFKKALVATTMTMFLKGVSAAVDLFKCGF